MPNLPITIVFHTHNRSDCLVETINSFFHYNNPKDFHKLYLLDDHSTKERDYSVEDYKWFKKNEGVYGHDYFKYSNPKDYVFGLDYAQEKGIELLHRNDKQLGCWPTIDRGFKKLKNLIPEDSIVLYLQNDCRFIRPWAIDSVRKLITDYGVQYVRLYGKYQNDSTKRKPLKNYDKFLKQKTVVDDEEFYINNGFGYFAQPHIATLNWMMIFAVNNKREADGTKRSRQEKYSHIKRGMFLHSVTEHYGAGTPFGNFGWSVKNSIYKRFTKKLLKQVRK